MAPLVIAGPTAIGKSAVAQFIAERTGAAIVSADSMLVYRGMDVGTAKPSRAERGRVRYIGLDCAEPDEPFSVGDWLARVRDGLAALPAGTPLVVVGGTGLYLKALLFGLDAPPANPAARARYQALFAQGGLEALRREVDARGIGLPPGDAANPRRLARALERAEAAQAPGGGRRLPPLFPGATVYGLTMARDSLAERIRRRAEAMLDGGLVEEAQRLPIAGTADGAIGYAEARAFARGELGREEAIGRIAARTRQLAKRQCTWLRHQLPVEWVKVAPGDTVEEVAGKLRPRPPAPVQSPCAEPLRE